MMYKMAIFEQFQFFEILKGMQKGVFLKDLFCWSPGSADLIPGRISFTPPDLPPCEI